MDARLDMSQRRGRAAKEARGAWPALGMLPAPPGGEILPLLSTGEATPGARVQIWDLQHTRESPVKGTNIVQGLEHLATASATAQVQLSDRQDHTVLKNVQQEPMDMSRNKGNLY